MTGNTDHLARCRYVGPQDIREAARSHIGGCPIRTEEDVANWLTGLPGQDRLLPHTFVIDTTGVLLVAPRRSEHVACAGGEPVLAAGEITFTRSGQGWQVSEATNQSTGYCPPVTSWAAVAAAITRAGLAHPGGFTAVFEFRRCPGCQQVNIVKDQDFTCAACGADLPAEWNFS